MSEFTDVLTVLEMQADFGTDLHYRIFSALILHQKWEKNRSRVTIGCVLGSILFYSIPQIAGYFRQKLKRAKSLNIQGLTFTLSTQYWSYYGLKYLLNISRVASGSARDVFRTLTRKITFIAQLYEFCMINSNTGNWRMNNDKKN
ncbi:hypothetical protein NPIL_75631 [Nephila pilipes]|uniref:Uncharacterized protein n=1 Tax=Nephila pilipes TaxID=299642 RepID=A0A8X6T8F8_NEPPI|nr:hypothetical protein NPIL_75631 [Nephila pilipes]